MIFEKQNIYFIGIGGIGMSALARYFNILGKTVAGYDRTVTDLTKRLQSEGMAITYFAEADAIPFPYKNKENTLVVYTPAIAKTNPILTYFKEEGFTCLKRAEILGKISSTMKTIAVAGTHGKTTVSSMIAFLLKENGLKINAFLGGISRDYGSNLLLDSEAEIMVTEADEYDRSFLQLSPHIAVITSVDADHLDIYSDHADVISTYKSFANRIDEKGVLITKEEVLDAFGLLGPFEKKSYACNKIAAIYADQIRVEKAKLHFDLHVGDKIYKDFQCGLPGVHNIENATAAIAVALEMGLSPEEIKTSLARFKGVKRRFDVHIQQDNFVYIDDYAHHPNEIKALLESVRTLYPERKITAVFQPHLYSRTRDFGDEFAEELAKADDVILLELYPAREEPIEGIDSRWLAQKMDKKDVYVCQKGILLKLLKSRDIDILLTIGAGDIDSLIMPIIEQYEA